jgi:hypothetical protein
LTALEAPNGLLEPLFTTAVLAIDMVLRETEE